MPLRNQDGTPVDPVPFLVVGLLGVAISYSWGPLFLTDVGLSLQAALAVSTVLCAAVVVVAFHRYVWTARPELADEIPAESRFRRLVYGVLVGVIATLALMALQVHLGG